ncbi:MAG: SDR family NAD(P)-dependent oxidoreductase [Candidatus Gastranaerophilales bacterium]|nr:SDR family NAD(P)-dependent oxidoreductase [Candidatus Gastranaerophilales bacterium]
MLRAFVTGGSRGIGKVICVTLKNNDIEVVAPTHKEMDLSSTESIRAYFKSQKPEFDILVNNAGINNLATLDEINDDAVQKMMQVNLLSQLELIKIIAPYMKRNKYGKIVNIASIWSDFSKEKRLLYTIAKSGVKGLTRATAVELSQYGILVNAVAPGFINTEMTAKNNTPEQVAEIARMLPCKRLGSPKEIAEFVYFLASEKNSFMTGQTIFVDGGFSCV